MLENLMSLPTPDMLAIVALTAVFAALVFVRLIRWLDRVV